MLARPMSLLANPTLNQHAANATQHSSSFLSNKYQSAPKKRNSNTQPGPDHPDCTCNDHVEKPVHARRSSDKTLQQSVSLPDALLLQASVLASNMTFIPAVPPNSKTVAITLKVRDILV